MQFVFSGYGISFSVDFSRAGFGYVQTLQTVTECAQLNAAIGVGFIADLDFIGVQCHTILSPCRQFFV